MWTESARASSKNIFFFFSDLAISTSAMDEYDEHRFKAAVSQALEVTSRVLGTARHFNIPEDQAHTYAESV